MGKVFTQSELLDGKIPTPHDFGTINGALRDLCKSDDVLAASLIGSTARAMAKGLPSRSPRSDIDCVVVYRDTVPYWKIVKLFAPVAHSAHLANVPLHILAYEELFVLAGLTDIGPGFAEHIRNPPTELALLKGDLREYFTNYRIDKHTEALMYVARKRDSLLRRLNEVYDETETARLYTKLTEASAHAVRRLLDVWGDLGGGKDDEESLVVQFERKFGGSREAKFLSDVNALNRSYSRFVESVRGGGLSRFEITATSTLFSQRFGALRFSVPEFLGDCLLLLGREI